MIPRAVVAVVLAVAVVAVALPGIDRARVGASDRTVRGEVERLERAAESLRSTDETLRGAADARRVVVVRLPAGTWRRAPVEYLAVGGSPGERAYGTARAGVVTYRIAGRPERRHRLGVGVVPAGEDPVVLREPGRHRLVLELVRVGNLTAVRVRRPRVYAGGRDQPGP